MININKNDKLVDWRNHSWRVVNPVLQTIVGLTGSSDGQRRYYTIQDDRVIIRGEFADHYATKQEAAPCP